MESWFSNGLIRWYHQNKRDLPWRKEKDPYKIWLSEIILQQTQVAQGLSYYLKFTETYPNVKQLAKAPEDEVLRLWQGLGYYSRARNLHAAAKTIAINFAGKFPSTYPEIRSLKGVGDYTASAIASFGFGLAHAVVDGNVYRVLSRVFGIFTPIDSNSAKKEFQDLAFQLLLKKDPATHNQAIMEFGSQFCKPVNPNCEFCIFKHKCYAFKTKTVSKLPVKEKKTKIRERHFNYLVIGDKKGNVLIQKREGKDIWKGLYEFNLIESKSEILIEELSAMKEFKAMCGTKHKILHISKTYKHILSHQHLYAKFYVVFFSGSHSIGQKKCKLSELKKHAFPQLTVKFLNDCDLKEIF